MTMRSSFILGVVFAIAGCGGSNGSSSSSGGGAGAADLVDVVASAPFGRAAVGSGAYADHGNAAAIGAGQLGELVAMIVPVQDQIGWV
jgi:hypothetical protein